MNNYPASCTSIAPITDIKTGKLMRDPGGLLDVSEW